MTKKAKKTENKKILIVDDESSFVDAFQMTMKAHANEVICTSCRAEAQEKMSENPDIVVVGTIAPAGEAFTLHKWLKQLGGLLRSHANACILNRKFERDLSFVFFFQFCGNDNFPCFSKFHGVVRQIC